MSAHPTNPSPDYTRRDFIKGGSLAGLAALLGSLPAQAQTETNAAPPKFTGPALKVGVIGLGLWGREILTNLARMPQAEIRGICDPYGVALRRGGNIAPKATQYAEHAKLIEDREISAVIVATPTPTHREIVEAALRAGKHVYCETPLAHTAEEAKALALAARNAGHLYFQAGLQYRSDPQRNFIMPFIRNGALGKWVMVRAQWHKKQSWRQASANPAREKQANWRLNRETSPGIIGEVGIHQLDDIAWFLDGLPEWVMGFGSIRGEWDDKRDVPDTAQVILGYPEGVQVLFDCTMANSFDAEHEIFYGHHSALMLRGNKAWLFKEMDAPMLGWEVNARKENFYKETGLVVAANATKLNVAADAPPEAVQLPYPPVYYAVERFLANASEIAAGVEDFKETFNPNDTAALKEYLAKIPLQPRAGYREGYAATVLALKANEAVLGNKKIALEKSWFELG